MEITKNAFDDLQYFVEMAEKNKLVKENGFYCGFCSGPEGLDQVMAEYRDHANFFLVDDTTSGNTFGANRVICDKATMKYGQALMYLNLESVFTHEYGRYSFNGATGLFFQLQNNEPLNLVFDPDEWEE